MGRKKFGITLVELLVAMVISGILIAVSSASIITAMRLFYGTKQSSSTDVELSAANTYLSRYIQSASFFSIPNPDAEGKGEVLYLFEYNPSVPNPTVPKWALVNVDNYPRPGVRSLTLITNNNPDGISLDPNDVNNKAQPFENVHATFSNYYTKDTDTTLPVNSRRPTEVKVEFTSPRFTSPITTFYSCGRVPSSYTWAISIPTKEGLFANFVPHGLKQAGNFSVLFGQTDRAGGRQGILSFFDNSNGHLTKNFTYSWVRGNASERPPLDIFTWNAAAGQTYSYIGGSIANTVTDPKPSALFVGRVNIDPSNPSAGNDTVLGGLIINNADLAEPTSSTNLRERSLISDIRENAADGSLLIAGQIYQNNSSSGYNTPRVFTANDIDVPIGTTLEDSPTLTNIFGPQSDATHNQASGVGWRFIDGDPKYVPKPPKFISPSDTSTDHFLVYNTSDGTNTDSRGTSNLGIRRIVGGALQAGETIVGGGFQYWQDSVATSSTDAVITCQSIATDTTTTGIMSYAQSGTGTTSKSYSFPAYVPTGTTGIAEYRNLSINPSVPDKLTAITSFHEIEDTVDTVVPFVVNFSSTDSSVSTCGPVFGPSGSTFESMVDMYVIPGNHAIVLERWLEIATNVTKYIVGCLPISSIITTTVMWDAPPPGTSSNNYGLVCVEFNDAKR